MIMMASLTFSPKKNQKLKTIADPAENTKCDQ